MEQAKLFTLLPIDFDHDFNWDNAKVLFIDTIGIGYDAEIVTYYFDPPNVLLITLNFFVTPPDVYQGNYFLTDDNNSTLHEIDLLEVIYYAKKI